MKANEPKIHAMPSFVVMDKYDGFEMLVEIFGHYDLDVFRDGIYSFYRNALIENAPDDNTDLRKEFTSLFVAINNLTTASYLICVQKGFIDGEGAPKSAFFPAWQPFSANPGEVFAETFSGKSLDEYRHKFWIMFTYAVQDACLDEEGAMDDFLFLFERLNDLFTACYYIFSTNPVWNAKTKVNAEL